MQFENFKGNYTENVMCPKDKKKESGRKLDRDGEEEKGDKKKTARKYN